MGLVDLLEQLFGFSVQAVVDHFFCSPKGNVGFSLFNRVHVGRRKTMISLERANAFRQRVVMLILDPCLSLDLFKDRWVRIIVCVRNERT